MENKRDWMKPVPELAAFQALTLTQPIPNPAVMRVNQLDAGVVDTELHGLLRMQMARTTSMVPQQYMEVFKPEIDAIVNLLLWRFTVWAQEPTPGMRLQNLRYRNESAATSGGLVPGAVDIPGVAQPSARQRLAWGILWVCGPWAIERLRRLAMTGGWAAEPSSSPRHAVWRAVGAVSMGWRIAAFVNLLAFLKGGRYPHVLDRVLGMRMVYGGGSATSAPRSINYSFLQRRLLWDRVAALAETAAPLVSVGARGITRRLTAPLQRRLRYHFGSSNGNLPSPGTGMSCTICGTSSPTHPYRGGGVCGHIFCYVCLSEAVALDANFACPSCDCVFESATPAVGGSESRVARVNT